MRLAEAARLDQLAAVANLTDGDALPVDTRVRTVMGQDYPQVLPGQQWKMSNNALFYTVQALATAVQVLTDTVAANRADVQGRLLLAQTAADAAQAVNDQQQAELARHNLAIQAAQSKAETADAKATAALAQNVAEQVATAEARQLAVAAQASAERAQAKADADERAVAAAQTTADQAKLLAQAAQASATALAARMKTKRVAVPLIGIGATGSIAVVWDTPFADDKYTVVTETEGSALLGLDPAITNKTATGCTVLLKNTLGLAITVAAGTISLLATHD